MRELGGKESVQGEGGRKTLACIVIHNTKTKKGQRIIKIGVLKGNSPSRKKGQKEKPVGHKLFENTEFTFGAKRIEHREFTREMGSKEFSSLEEGKKEKDGK